MGFAPRGSPSPKRMGFASRGSPSPKRMGFASNVGSSCSKRPFSRGFFSKATLLKGFPFPKGFASASKRMVFASRDSHSPKQQSLSRGTQILPRRRIHSELCLVSLQLRDPIRGLLPPILIHLYDKIWKLKTPLFQAQLRP